MGRHASGDRRRRVAAWPIIVVVAALVVAGLAVGYFVVLNSTQKTAACSGSTVLPVVASPGAAVSVRDAATAFDATVPVSRSTCVTVTVDTMAGATAGAALAAGWKDQKTSAPGLWVVDSAPDLAALDASNSAMTAGHGNSSLATSPVVLAMRTPPAAGAVSWKSLSGGAASPVVPAIPTPAGNRASSYALESIVAAARPTTPVDAAAVAGSTAVFDQLAAAAPNAPATTAAALTALAGGDAAYTAVPVVESDLAAFNTAHPPGLTAVYPAGPTAGDSIMAVPLTAQWVTDAMTDAAAAFDAFLGGAQGTAIFTANALRTESAPPTVPGVDLRTPVTPLAGSDASTRALIDRSWSAAVIAARTPAATSAAATATVTTSTPAPPTATTASTPATSATKPTPTPPPRPIVKPAPKPPSVATTKPDPPGPVVTLVLDSSGSMDIMQNGRQRMTWMQNAVYADLQKDPADWFGTWSFSTQDGPSGYTQMVTTGALTEQVNGNPRAAAITSAVKGLTPGGDSWTYAAIQASYTSAVNSAVAGRPNRVIVITDGLDTTPGLSRTALVAAISALAAQKKNVALDVIGLSETVNADAMNEISGAGGGTYTAVDNLADLQPTLLRLSAAG